MRKQYHLRLSKNGFLAWDVDKLIEKAKDLPIVDYPISDIPDLNENYWYQNKKIIPTIHSIIEHMQLVKECNLRYPILIAHDGKVMDGMHRIVKSVLQNRKTIKARQFNEYIPPDFIDVQEEDLSYD